MANCQTCVSNRSARLSRLGVELEGWDFVVALAGNPNTGKSTIFNSLTGLRQHTGNWPGKTIARAEGGFSYQGKNFKLVDLPGTYSLLSASPDEEVARNFILFGQPDITVVVLDATHLERNLNLALQVLQITEKVVICLNLMDEAKAHNISIDIRGLARDLGVPVVSTEARQGKGIAELLEEIARVSIEADSAVPRRINIQVSGLNEAINTMVNTLKTKYPSLLHLEWIALRLLEGDQQIENAIRDDTIGTLVHDFGSSTID